MSWRYMRWMFSSYSVQSRIKPVVFFRSFFPPMSDVIRTAKKVFFFLMIDYFFFYYSRRSTKNYSRFFYTLSVFFFFFASFCVSNSVNKQKRYSAVPNKDIRLKEIQGILFQSHDNNQIVFIVIIEREEHT